MGPRSATVPAAAAAVAAALLGLTLGASAFTPRSSTTTPAAASASSGSGSGEVASALTSAAWSPSSEASAASSSLQMASSSPFDKILSGLGDAAEALGNAADDISTPSSSSTPEPSSGGGDGEEALPPMDAGPEALFARARAVVASDLGVRDPSLLATGAGAFQWVGPDAAGGTGALGREEYMAAGKFFDLRSAFPDLDYRAHDYRLDARDPFTVRVTVRTVGTMRGELRLRSETLPPNGKRLSCPPETVSITFNPLTGKVTKLVSGMVMDRLVGNTGGLTGVMAAATVAGAPPSDWELYPPATVIGRFFGRSVKQLEETSSVLAPFPETVMIQLAKGVVAADNGASDPDLLGPSFTFCGPYVGPLPKDEFVEAFGNFKLRDAFPDLESGLTNFRVDPYDPYRVWADARGSGTNLGALAGGEPTGAFYDGPPEAVSFTFDDDGFCTRLTAGAVMDPSMGNTGGLGGVFGIFYAVGRPLPGLATRPLSQNLGRIQKRLLEPFTKRGVDDIVLSDDAPLALMPAPPKIEAEVKAPAEIAAPGAPKKDTPAAKAAAALAGPPPKAPPKAPPAKKEEAPPKKKAEPFFMADETKPKAKAAAPPPKAPPKPTAQAKKPEPPKIPAPPQAKPPVATQKQGWTQGKKSQVTPVIGEEPGDPVSDALASFFGTKTSDAAAPKAKAPAPAKKTAVTPPKATVTPPKAAPKKKAAVAKKQIEEPQEVQFVTADDIARFRAESEAARKKAQEGERETAAAKSQVAANDKKAEAEARRAASARAKKEEVERKALEAAAAKKRMAEEKRSAAEAAQVAAAQKREEALRAKEEAVEARRRQAEEKKAAAQMAAATGEARRREAEEKQAVAVAAAQARKDEAERKKQVATEKKVAAAAAAQAAAEARKEAAERKKQDAEEKKAAVAAKNAEVAAKKRAAAEAVAAKKAELEQKRQAAAAAAQAKKEEADAKRRAAAAAAAAKGQQQGLQASKAAQQQAKKALESAKPKTTIDLFNLFGGQSSASDAAAKRKKGEEEKAAQAKAQAGLEAAKALESAKPKTTIDLFNLFGGQPSASDAAAAKKKKEEEEKTAAAKAQKAAAATAEAALKAAKPGMTISLFDMFGGGAKSAAAPKPAPTAPKAAAAPKRRPAAPAKKAVVKKAAAPKRRPAAPAKKAVAKKAAAQAPRGVPVLSQWKSNRDGSVSGLISGSPSFDEGEPVTTSAIRGEAVGGAVVQTSSGSRYFLEEGSEAPAGGGGLFGFLSGGDSATKPKPKPKQVAPKPRAKAVAPKPKAVAPKTTQKTSAQRAAAAKKAQDSLKAAKPGSTINLFGMGGAPPKVVPNEKATAAGAAKAKQQAANAKRAEAALKAAKPGATINLFGLGGPSAAEKADEEARRKAEAAAKAEAALKAAKPGITINLFDIFGGGAKASKPAAVAKPAPKKKALRAPRGVPVITGWKANRDKSVTGFISGSPNFEDGSSVTTSTIASGEFEEGSVVTTSSGSKYFLG